MPLPLGDLEAERERLERLARWWGFDVEYGANVMHEHVEIVLCVMRSTLNYGTDQRYDTWDEKGLYS